MKIFLRFLIIGIILVSCAKEPNNSITSTNNEDNIGVSSSSESSSASSEGYSREIPENTKGEYIEDDWFLPYPKPRYCLNYGGRWKDKLEAEWKFYKREMIDQWGIGLVVNNKKEKDLGNKYAAFSEGVAYGMIFSLYMNDQEYFNKIWDAAESRMRQPSGYFGWRYNVDDEEFTNSGDKTSASDAEIEITYALLAAAKLVEKGYWEDHKNPHGQTYKERAEELLDLIYNPDDPEGNTQIKFNIILPGDAKMWGWTDYQTTENIGYNPSYFMPAYLKEFGNYKHREGFERVIDKCYSILKKVNGYNKGLAPDWCNTEGGQITSLSRRLESQKEQYYMYLDAIRVPFRIGTDAIWFNDARAKEYCNNAASYIDDVYKAGFYSLDGVLVTLSNTQETLNKDIYEVSWMAGTFFDYATDKPEEEYTTASFHALAMWLGAIMGSDNEDLKVAFAEKLKSCWVENGQIDANTTETMPRFGIKESWVRSGNWYFAHSLAMFGALMASGCYTNILEDLK